ncbi:Rhodanese-like domain-containing protein [Lactarius sanguifluus]|nr:Rhodanese-like domain-containing protein [Lactarius sanguifluus]
MNPPKPTPAWALSFPEPRSHPLRMSPEALHELLTTKSAAVDFVVVDVRRTDIDAMITGAINLPAQTFYPLLPTLTSILGKFPIVVFHCSSSLGRAPRCAGWLQDTLPPGSECKVFILEGGMKAWRERFGEDAQMIIEMPVEEGEDTGTRK